MKDFFFLILGLLIIGGSFFLLYTQKLEQINQTRVIKINDTNITVEIVDTPKTRTLGLSGRSDLAEGTGMLFVFETPSVYAFWMKDMHFSIDIVWIDENFGVVGVERDVSPETFPQNFSPNQAVKYVLELPAGAVDKYRIGIGAVVQ